MEWSRVGVVLTFVRGISLGRYIPSDSKRFLSSSVIHLLEA